MVLWFETCYRKISQVNGTQETDGCHAGNIGNMFTWKHVDKDVLNQMPGQELRPFSCSKTAKGSRPSKSRQKQLENFERGPRVKSGGCCHTTEHPTSRDRMVRNDVLSCCQRQIPQLKEMMLNILQEKKAGLDRT